MPRRLAVLVVLAVLPGLAASDALAATKRPCRPKLSAKCLKKARGDEAVAIRTSGTIDRATALQAFVQTVAPLPGVPVRRGAVAKLRSGSGPIRWLAPYRKTLTPAQRKAYDAVATGRRPGRARKPRARAAVTPSAAQKKAWKELLSEAIGRLTVHFGVPLGAGLSVTLATAAAEGDDAAADAELHAGTCNVNVYPEAWAGGMPLIAKRFIAAHEITHCFQDRLAGPFYDDKDRAWLIEGSAEWAGGVVAQEWSGAPLTWPGYRAWYDAYLETPDAPMFVRSYSGVGFYGHLQRSGADVWARLRIAYAAASMTSAYTTMVSAADTGFLTTWASGFARRPSWGAAWDTDGPGIPSTAAPMPLRSLGKGSTVTVAAAARSAPIERVSITADVVELSRSGAAYGRLRDADGTELGLDPNALCARAGGCTCPEGTEGASLGSLPKIASGVATAAVAAHISPATFTLRGRSLDEFCKKPGAKPAFASDLFASGAVGARGQTAGSCRVGDEFFAIFQLDGPVVDGGPGVGTYPKPYYLQLAAHWDGPGTYVTQGRGVTSRPTVHFTDGEGHSWQTEDVPGFDPTGSFTVNEDARSGTVDVTMYDKDSGSTEHATGRWRCEEG